MCMPQNKEEISRSNFVTLVGISVKGEVCLEDGKLEIKIALCPITRAYLERVINDLAGIKNPPKGKEKEEKPKSKPLQETEHQLCLFDVS